MAVIMRETEVKGVTFLAEGIEKLEFPLTWTHRAGFQGEKIELSLGPGESEKLWELHMGMKLVVQHKIRWQVWSGSVSMM